MPFKESSKHGGWHDIAQYKPWGMGAAQRHCPAQAGLLYAKKKSWAVEMTRPASPQALGACACCPKALHAVLPACRWQPCPQRNARA